MPQPSGNTAERPALRERRKEQTRHEVALEAVNLFTAQGVAATSGEEVARAAGMSVRTLWRYFPTKESFVQPLLAAGAEATAAWLRDWPRDVSLLDHLSNHRHQSARDLRAGAVDSQALGDLLRLMRREPALRAVWLQAHHDAEAVFAEVLAERVGGSPDSLEIRVQAAAINSALRVAAEQHAWYGEDDAEADVDAIYRGALSALAHALPQD